MDRLLEPFAGDASSRLAAVLRAEFGTLSQVMTAPRSHLLEAGKDFSKACHLLLAAREIVDAASRERIAGSRISVSDPVLLEYLQRRLATGQLEKLLIIFCNEEGQYILDEEMGWGTKVSVRIDMKYLFGRAATLGARQFLLAHNHPSGICEPSEDDIAATKRLRNAAIGLGMKILDHLIITKRSVYSMRNGGLL